MKAVGLLLLLIASWLQGSASSFLLFVPPKQGMLVLELRKSSSSANGDNVGGGVVVVGEPERGPQPRLVDRRSMLSITAKKALLFPATTASAILLETSPYHQIASAATTDSIGKGKIVVMGGAGYVGSRVSTILAESGYNVVSVSRSSPTEQAAKIQANVGNSRAATAANNIEYVSLDATKDDLGNVMKGAAVVISCVGIPPWEKKTARAGNGIANTRIAEAAKAAGVDRYVYVSVAKEFANGPGKFLFNEFFTGKAEAEAAAIQYFGQEEDENNNNKVVFVKPGLIDGAPPGELRPPGPPGMMAISPDAVAKAVVAGALGQVNGSIDGYNAIMAVADK